MTSLWCFDFQNYIFHECKIITSEKVKKQLYVMINVCTVRNVLLSLWCQIQLGGTTVKTSIELSFIAYIKKRTHETINVHTLCIIFVSLAPKYIYQCCQPNIINFFYQGFVSDVQEFLIYEHMSFVHVHAVKCMQLAL